MAQDQHMRITILGTRGSSPVFGKDYSVFGGSTSCYLVEAGDETIILDAGSGLANAPVTFPKTPVILLSHLHLDHLIGLGTYGRLSQSGLATRLCVPARDAQGAKKIIDHLFAPPLWPLELGNYGGNLQFYATQKIMRIGEATVETEWGNHPGGCFLIKISFAQKTIVYATDFDHDDERACDRLVTFAHGADLLLYDGQYDDESYKTHRGFGHSTYRAGVAMMERSGAKRLLIVHHDPQSIDSTLLDRERRVGRDDVRFAREGEAIEL